MIIMALVPTISRLPWSATFIVISVVMLVIATFFASGSSNDASGSPRWRINFGWAGVLFAVLGFAFR